MKHLIAKEQLLFEDHYHWSDIPEDDPRVSGPLADVDFEPLNGNQVLYFINQLITIWKFDEIKYARKIEKMIKIGLPKNVGSQKDAKAWIKDHWLNY